MRHRTAWAIAALAIALAGGCSKRVDDAALATNIKAQMFSDAQLKDVSLQVSVKNGEVTLAGSVPSDAARYEAFKLATQTPGVTKVDDQMTIEAPQPPVAQTEAPPETAPVAPPVKHHRKARANEPAPEPSSPAESADNDANAPPQDQDQAAAPQLAPEPPSPASPIASPPIPPPAPVARDVVIPAGTTLTVRMIDTIDSSVNHAGDIFHAALENPLVVGDEVVVPKGQDVYIRLVNASSAGHYSGKSDLRLEAIKLEFQGRSYPLVTGAYDVAGKSRGKNTAEKVGGGAVLGTIIGAIAGGGKGAAIGAGVGAAGGGVYQTVTHGKQVRIPSETKLDFDLNEPVTVTVVPRSTPDQ